MWQKSDFYANNSGLCTCDKIRGVSFEFAFAFDGADSPTGPIEMVPVGLCAPQKNINIYI